jgi:hypothetical protein
MFGKYNGFVGKARVYLLTNLKIMTDCQEWDKQEFNFQRQIFGKSFHIQEL